jgi:hypothetical protein
LGFLKKYSMANHCRVLTKKTLDPKEVDKLVKKISREKLFHVFKVRFNKKENSWYVFHPSSPGYMALTFWLSDENEYDESGTPNVLLKQSVIEFRHGHSYSFLWWIEGVFRENLAKHYGAQTRDDGDWVLRDACPEDYETYEIYAKDTHPMFDEQKSLPEDVINILKVKGLTPEEIEEKRKIGMEILKKWKEEKK